MSSTQLESPQSEVWNLRYELNKMAMSAVRTSKVFGHNSLYIQPKLMNFGQSESYEIPELLQLDLTQSEVHSPRYKIMKVTGSAEFTNSVSSNVSSISPVTCTG
jgi:hypothetical protein